MIFIISIILIILRPNIIRILLGWDGLGLTSYCLIIYYQNYNSFISGKLTLISNRIGDVILLIIIFLMLNLISWNLLFYNFKNNLLIFIILILIITKRAQIPLSIWLPAAIAAPTPVSSLVHSSTLVTAGIYLLIRFNKIFFYNNIRILIIFIGLLTILLSRLNALFIFDIKKIIAFSTLSQLGLIIFILSFNLTNYVFFHLISHAIFKSLLFLCAGVYIHILNGIQDIRYIGRLIIELPIISIYFNVANISLNGFFFLSGYYSKDLLYEIGLNFNLNLFIYIFIYLCVILTIIYRIRLRYYLIFNLNLYNSLKLKFNSLLIIASIFLLFIIRIIFGSIINWILFSSLNYSIINLNNKFNLYLIIFLGIFILFIINLISINCKLLIYKIIYIIRKFLYLIKLLSLFFLKKIKIIKFINNINEFRWNEYYQKFIILFFLKKINYLFINIFNNILINLFFIIIYIFIIFYLIN